MCTLDLKTLRTRIAEGPDLAVRHLLVPLPPIAPANDLAAVPA